MFFGAGGAGSWKGRRALTRLLLSLATEQKFEVTSTLFVISYVFLVSQDALEAMFLWCLWALTKRRDNIVLADMVADMEVDKVADMVADMEVDKVADKKKKRKRVANMELDMVADMEIDKVADMVADMVADIEIQFGERVGHGVGWAQTCLTRSLPGFASLFRLMKTL